MAGKTQEIFEQFARESCVEITYDEFTAEMDAIMAMEDAVAREKRMQSFYRGITDLAATSAMIHRGLMSLSDVYNARYFNNIHTNTVLTEIAVVRLLDSYCKEKNFDYKCEQKMGRSNAEYMEFLSGIANKVTMARVQREFFKLGNEEMFCEALNTISGRFARASGGYVFSPSLGSEEDKNIAEGYAVYEHLKAIQDSKKLRGILRHPIRYLQARSALKAMEKTFKNIGFDIKEHAADVKAMMEEMPDHATIADFNAIDDYSERRQKEIARRKMEAEFKEISFARPKYEKAIEAEEKGGPDTAFAKINAVYAKYGQVCPKDSDGLPKLAHPLGAEKSLAALYDGSRALEGTGDYMKHCFYVNINNIVAAACEHAKQTGGKINVTEVLKDASECSNIMYEKFTVIFDANESREEAQNSTFGTCEPNKVFNYLKKAIENAGALENYDENELKAEIESVVSTYVHPLSQKAREAELKRSENQVENTVSATDNIIADDQPNAPEEGIDEVRIKLSLDPKDLGETKSEVAPEIGQAAPVKKHTITNP